MDEANGLIQKHGGILAIITYPNVRFIGIWLPEHPVDANPWQDMDIKYSGL